MNPLLCLPPETAHSIAIWAVKNGIAGIGTTPYSNPKEILGLTFPNPVGLSGGADKQAEALKGWANIGFGFVETGTVTLHPRTGNPKPRVWRFKDKNSVVNWMGLPGDGLNVFIKNLENYRNHHDKKNLIVGVSIASPEGNLDDFKKLSATCAPLADYITLNASCPNTEENITNHALSKAMTDQIHITKSESGLKPVLIKLGPTRNIQGLESMVKAALDAGIDGFVATNTLPPENKGLIDATIQTWPQHNDKDVGGYSGPALLDISKWMVSNIREIAGSSVPIMGVGGIQSGEDAKSVIEAGADLIQIYTGFIYKGPKLVHDINKYLIENTKT